MRLGGVAACAVAFQRTSSSATAPDDGRALPLRCSLRWLLAVRAVFVRVGLDVESVLGFLPVVGANHKLVEGQVGGAAHHDPVNGERKRVSREVILASPDGA